MIAAHVRLILYGEKRLYADKVSQRHAIEEK